MEKYRLILFGTIFLACFVRTTFSTIHTYYMEDLCRNNAIAAIKVGSTFSGLHSSGIIMASENSFYKSNFSCKLILEPDSENGIVVAIRRINFRGGCVDQLTFAGLIYTILPKRVMYCNNYFDDMESRSFYSSRHLGIFFNTLYSDVDVYGGFTLTFTAVRVGLCRSNEYICDNFRCIAKSLTCDGHNHCGDKSDMYYCKRKVEVETKSTWSIGKIVGVVIGTIVLVIIFCLRLLCACA